MQEDMEDGSKMILTIQFTANKNYIISETTQDLSLLASCNIHIRTTNPEAIVMAYQKYLSQLTPDYSGNAASLLAEVSSLVFFEHPDSAILFVSEDTQDISKNHIIQVELTRKSSEEHDYTM